MGRFVGLLSAFLRPLALDAKSEANGLPITGTRSAGEMAWLILLSRRKKILATYTSIRPAIPSVRHTDACLLSLRIALVLGV